MLDVVRNHPYLTAGAVVLLLLLIALWYYYPSIKARMGRKRSNSRPSSKRSQHSASPKM